MVPRGNKFETARKYCWSHGMRLFQANTVLASNYLLNYVKIRYPKPNKDGFLFIDSGANLHPQRCNIVHYSGTYKIGQTSCTQSGWFICEFATQGMKIQIIKVVVAKPFLRPNRYYCIIFFTYTPCIVLTEFSSFFAYI